MPQNILKKILDVKQNEIAQAKQVRPTERLLAELPAASTPRDFLGALIDKPGIGLIAEIKYTSPSHGRPFRKDFDPVAIAQLYEKHGAACISCLTDKQFFGGSLEHLRAIRDVVSTPILRKDFLIDEYQVLESRVAGADCILLIAECIDDDQKLKTLMQYASELGMHSLVEVHHEDNLARAMALEPQMLGVNSRNLENFKTDMDHVIELSQRVPTTTLFVGESGIRSKSDIEKLQAAGVRAILVGSVLMSAENIGEKLDELLSQS